MSFPNTSPTSGTAAENLLINAGAAAGLAMPAGGLSMTDYLAALVGNMAIEAPPATVRAASMYATAENAAFGLLRVARAVYDPSTTAGDRTVAAHSLGVAIPAAAIIVGGFIQVNTTFTSASADSGTIAISVEGANDIVTATAISDGSNIWDAGLQAIVPKVNTPQTTSVVTTIARNITATVGTAALTAGKLTIFLYYHV